MNLIIRFCKIFLNSHRSFIIFQTVIEVLQSNLYNKIMHNKSFYPLKKQINLIQQGKLNSFILIAFFIAAFLFTNVNSIVASKPIIASPNTQSSPSNFIFNFILQKNLQSTGYLMINFSPLVSTATPISCLVVNSSSLLAITTCQNLDTGSTAGTLSVNKTWINQFNPNILSTKTIVIQFNANLVANQQYSIQILTNNLLPALGSITSNFQLFTISGTGFMLQQNWNFGQVYFRQRQDKNLVVNSINDLTQNQPGSLSSNLQFQITIGVQSPTPYSVIKFIISGSFQFSPSSLVNVQGVLSTAPQVLSTQIKSPNIIVTRFAESFAIGRKFKILITDIKNPLTISTGSVSVYYLPDNSMSPLQIKQNSIPIGTKIYSPTIQVLTGEGINAFSPVQFYQSKQQYITVTIVLPRQFDSSFIIQVLTDTLTIHEGTVYAKANTVLASKLLYNHYTSTGVRISGFPNIASGSKITITMKVWIPVTPSFNIQVRIDKQSSIANSIIKGNAPTIDTVVGQQFVSVLTGNAGETYKLTSALSATATPYSFITFSVTPTFLTQAGSSLKIYTCQNLIKAPSFSTTTSCQVNSVASSCTLVTNDTITLITIASGSSNNLFVANTITTVKIKDLQYRYTSSNSEYIYQFYFQMTSSQSSTSPIIKKTIHTPIVIPSRPVSTTGFSNYFSNDLYNTGTNYPNIFRIVSNTFSKWNYIIQSTQRRIITVFHKQKWTKLFTTLKSGDSYPFLSTLPGVTSTFIQGTTSNSSINCPLNWDQLHFILPGGQNSTSFSLAIPLTYMVDIDFNFELMAGIYNIQTRTIMYNAIQVMPVLGSTTFKRFSSIAAVSSKTKNSTIKLRLAGRAGSYKSNIQLYIVPSGTYNAASLSSAIIITSSWNWFDSTSSINTANLSKSGVTYPTYTNDHQKPLSLSIGTDLYLTYIPFTTTGLLNTPWSLFFDNVKLPYTHDLPYYSIVLVDQSGTIDSYNEFINQDQGVFYSTALQKISLTCSDNSLGVMNTDCSIGFIPNNQIQIKSKIYVTMTGLRVATSKCILIKNSDNTSIQNTCTSNTDQNQLVVTLKNTARLADSTQYTLTILGMSIDSTNIVHYVDMSLRDPSGGYIIQTGKRILITSVSAYFPIYIQQMTYLKNNPIVVSGFNIIFTLPRKLNKDELFAIVMGNDLSNLNSAPSKLKIRLYYHTNNTQIPNVRWFLNTKNYQILFEGLHGYLDALKYRLQIYGLKTPSTIDQKIISLIYLRTYDNSYTVQNTLDSTSIYPSLVDKVNSLITLKSYMNTEGVEQPLQFNITGQFAKVNANTVWYITLPKYYSQSIWNDDYLMYCTISSTKLDCSKHQNLPYTIVVKNSPRVIDIGTWYTIVIHGITCPRALYLNGNSTYVTESIFFGMALNDIAQSYIEYSQLFMTDTVINPQAVMNYGTIIVRDIISSNVQTYQTTFFSISLVCTVPIVPTDFLFITFPKGFDNFNDIPLQGQIVLGALRLNFTATTTNTKLTIQIPAGITILSNNTFSIQISSLPTPKLPIIVDMNKLIVTLSNTTRSSTKASSLQLINQVSTKQFSTQQLHLVINNYQTIQLTAGTLTNDLIAQSSDLNAFVSNMRIQFISNSLSFQPNPLSLYLGSKNGKFKIGAPQTLIPTLYTFDLRKSQTSLSAFYTVLSKYSVLVTNTPKTITLPTSVNMPKGGCSIPFKIALSNAPISDMSLSFQYDSAVYTLDQFWINQQISYNQLQFTKSITQRWVSFCSISSLSAVSIPVSIYLGGTNANAYTLSTTTITVNVQSNATTIPAPTLTLAVANSQKTYAKLTATVNLNGFLYYQLKLSPLTTPLQLVDLKIQIKQKNLSIQSQNDFLNKQIYTNDRDYRINYVSITSGSNDLQFDGLLPQRQYTFCAFFQNQHRVATSRVCKTFTMQTWGLVKKIYIQYKDTLFQNQLNNILCYFVKASNAKVSQIVSLQGKSCSLNTSASNYYFNFGGQMQANQLTSTIIYHVSDMNLTTDPSSSSFSALYDANGITTSALSTALANFSINYINSSYSLGSFNPIDSIKINLDSFKPQLTFTPQLYTRSSFSLFLRGVRLSRPGSVYFVLTSYKKIVKNSIAARSDIEIRPLITPSYQQILNCKDGYDIAAISCTRVVIKDGESIDVKFTGVEENRMYAIYYVVANQYPLRPILYGPVKVQQMGTLVLFGSHFLTSIFIMIAFSIMIFV